MKLIFAMIVAVIGGLILLVPQETRPKTYTVFAIVLIAGGVVYAFLEWKEAGKFLQQLTRQLTRIERKVDKINYQGKREEVVYSEAKRKRGFDVFVQGEGPGGMPKIREFPDLSYYRISMSTSWTSYDDGMFEIRVRLFSKKAFLGKKYIFDFISRQLNAFKNRMSLFFESFDETNFLTLQIFTMSALSFAIREDVSNWELDKSHYIAITWQPTKGVINLFLDGKLRKSYEAKDVAFELDKPFLFLGSDYQGKYVGQFKVVLPTARPTSR